MRSEALYLYGHIASAAFPNTAVQMFVTQTPNVPALLGPNNTNFYRWARAPRCVRRRCFFCVCARARARCRRRA